MVPALLARPLDEDLDAVIAPYPTVTFRVLCRKLIDSRLVTAKSDMQSRVAVENRGPGLRLGRPLPFSLDKGKQLCAALPPSIIQATVHNGFRASTDLSQRELRPGAAGHEHRQQHQQLRYSQTTRRSCSHDGSLMIFRKLTSLSYLSPLQPLQAA